MGLQGPKIDRPGQNGESGCHFRADCLGVYLERHPAGPREAGFEISAADGRADIVVFLDPIERGKPVRDIRVRNGDHGAVRKYAGTENRHDNGEKDLRPKIRHFSIPHMPNVAQRLPKGS